MCGVETYLDLVNNPLTDKRTVNELEKRNQTQSNIITDLVLEKNKIKTTLQRKYKGDINYIKKQYKKNIRNLKQENKKLNKQKQLQQRNNKNVPKLVKEAVFKRDNYTCLCCGIQTDLSIDHIVPRSSGGSNDMSNLQTLCRSCNSAKSDKYVDYRSVESLMEAK